MEVTSIVMPDAVNSIIDTLSSNGFEAYAVGGCVRDSILGRKPDDWDVTTSAKPEDVKKLFDKTFDTGIKHGTVTVVMNGINYEVTTYRVDGDYSDGRHPDSVEFTSNLQEDLLRRDFTINAMAYNHEFGFIDLYQGKEDLDRKLIRCVGDPNERFKEDALRMLRAIRFSAQLDFDIELQTYEAIKNNADLIQNVSFERIRDEITKIIMSDKPEKFLALYDTGLMEYVMPEFIPNIGCPQNSPWHKYTVDQHIMHTVMNVPNTFELRWTMLLHDIAKAKCRTTDSKGYDHFANHPIDGSIIAHDILQRFRFDNKSIRTIVRLIRYHDIAISLDEVKIRRTISTVGEDIFMQLLDVMDADDSAKAEVVWIESREKNKALRQIYQLFKERGYCLKKSQLAITGFDLQGIGIDEGKEMGELLDYLFQEVLVNPEWNNRDKLLEMAIQKSGVKVDLSNDEIILSFRDY